jgi:bacteriorhodopsin
MYTYANENGDGGRKSIQKPGMAFNGKTKENFEMTPSSSNWFWWALALLVLIVMVLLIMKWQKQRRAPSTAFGYKFY